MWSQAQIAELAGWTILIRLERIRSAIKNNICHIKILKHCGKLEKLAIGIQSQTTLNYAITVTVWPINLLLTKRLSPPSLSREDKKSLKLRRWCAASAWAWLSWQCWRMSFWKVPPGILRKLPKSLFSWTSHESKFISGITIDSDVIPPERLKWPRSL